MERLPDLAAAVVVGAILAALLFGDGRRAIAAMTVSLVAAAFVQRPLPALGVTGFQVVAALLAGYLLMVAGRRRTLPDRPPLGGLPEAAAVAAAALLGWLLTPVANEATGPGPALVAGLALGMAGLDLLVMGSRRMGLAVGALAALGGVQLLVTFLGGNPTAPVSLAGSALLVAVAAVAGTLQLGPTAGPPAVAVRPGPPRGTPR